MIGSNTPIIQIDFSTLNAESAQELKVSLVYTLESLGKVHGIDLTEAPSPGLKLKLLIRQLAQKNPVVILIDNYDHPLINTIDNQPLAIANRKVLKNVFSILKSMDGYLKAMFITGVTNFSKATLFAGLHVVNDPTIDHHDMEIDHDLDAYLQQLCTEIQ